MENNLICEKKVVSFGEILLRLAAPGYTRLFQENSLESTFCGGEANVAVSLAIFGLNSQFVTALPDNDIGQAAINSLRYFGVDCSRILRAEGRMGVYYLEKGASQRASKVIYDRQFSAISKTTVNDFNWEKIFEGVEWFHWTGITPALSDSVAEVCLEACKVAKRKGIKISCDLNYRKNLWTSEKAQSVMKKLMHYVDVCIANEEDVQRVLGIYPEETDVDNAKLNLLSYEKLAKKISDIYGCEHVAFTLRESYSASENGWSGLLYDNKIEKSFYSTKYRIHIVDRVGGGDSFTAGLIYGLITGMDEQTVIEFAAAASCLKHSIEGDFNRTSIQEVMSLVNGNGNGRVQR